ncbi:hypothetical protein MSC38_01170 [Acinetobacter baumannii]|uniref:hypothetical protein n=1 Tax=Acinetobacter baumannii TaxID=470 RepID=UPI0029408608|nr:hypothetical protein [Acinetobacter baumannii]MDV4226918.1 hypothetical protein [Acinetobacter baumannii]
MDKCKHGFDKACLVCGFGEFNGRRVFYEWKYEQMYSSFTNLHHARITAPESLIKLALEAINNEIAMCRQTECNLSFGISKRNQAFVIRETLQNIEAILKGETVELKKDNSVQVGSRVLVDFYSSNRAETDGTHIHGYGVVDQIDQDGKFVIGRLEKGGFFGYPATDVKLAMSLVPEAILEAERQRSLNK